MVELEELESCLGPRRRRQPIFRPIEVRMSILDPCLETEPWIDQCPCSETLVLFVQNHPVAVIPGSPIDWVSLNMRLHQLRHRWPRQ